MSVHLCVGVCVCIRRYRRVGRPHKTASESYLQLSPSIKDRCKQTNKPINSLPSRQEQYPLQQSAPLSGLVFLTLCGFLLKSGKIMWRDGRGLVLHLTRSLWTYIVFLPSGKHILKTCCKESNDYWTVILTFVKCFEKITNLKIKVCFYSASYVCLSFVDFCSSFNSFVQLLLLVIESWMNWMVKLWPTIINRSVYMVFFQYPEPWTEVCSFTCSLYCIH